jgi:hypothetical protein
MTSCIKEKTMSPRFLVFAGLFLAGAFAARYDLHGQTAAYYNPYNGASAAARTGYNPYTGTAGRSETSYNPYTGRDVTEKQVYNPYTGRSAEERTVTNPYTGRSTSSYAYRRR